MIVLISALDNRGASEISVIIITVRAVFVDRGRKSGLPSGNQRRRPAEGFAEAQDQGRKRVRYPGTYQGPGTSPQHNKCWLHGLSRDRGLYSEF